MGRSWSLRGSEIFLTKGHLQYFLQIELSSTGTAAVLEGQDSKTGTEW